MEAQQCFFRACLQRFEMWQMRIALPRVRYIVFGSTVNSFGQHSRQSKSI
jgi:hypothetical protein